MLKIFLIKPVQKIIFLPTIVTTDHITIIVLKSTRTKNNENKISGTGYQKPLRPTTTVMGTRLEKWYSGSVGGEKIDFSTPEIGYVFCIISFYGGVTGFDFFLECLSYVVNVGICR